MVVIKINYKSQKGVPFKSYDAPVYFDPINLDKVGPWFLVGGESISDKSLTVDAQKTGRVELDEAAKKKLEQLGYIQTDQ